MLGQIALALATLQGGHLQIAWNKNVGGYWNFATDGVNVYALSKSGMLKVFSGDSGSILFEKSFGSKGAGIATLSDGTSYIVVDGALKKLNRDLTVAWTSAQKVQYPEIGVGIAVGEDGTVVVNTTRGVQIYKGDGTSDGLTTMLGISVGGSKPVFIDKKTVAFLGANACAITVPDRKQVWASKTGAGAEPVLFGPSIYISSNETIAKACVTRISAYDGKPVWTTPTTTINHAPAVSKTAVVVPGDLGMWGLETSTGKVGWRNSLHTISRAFMYRDEYAVVMAKGNSNSVCIGFVDALTGKVVEVSPPVFSGVAGTFEPPFIPVGTNAVAGFFMGQLFLVKVY